MTSPLDRDNSPIEDYLDELLVALQGDPRRARHLLLEAEDHLRSSTESLVAQGFDPIEAEREAVRRYGPVPDVARALRRLAPEDLVRPLVGLTAVGLIAIGVSGVIADVMGRLWGPMFVSGDLTGTTYTPERCTDFVRLYPGHECLQAAALDHWGETVQYRVVVGLLGLIALLVYRFLRRGTPLPGGIIPGVALTLFGFAAALLGAVSLQAALDNGRGLGAPLSAAIVSLVMVALCAWRLWSGVNGRHRAVLTE
jgi:hypothetical protein